LQLNASVFFFLRCLNKINEDHLKLEGREEIGANLGEIVKVNAV
jgi:hypothetical protein